MTGFGFGEEGEGGGTTPGSSGASPGSSGTTPGSSGSTPPSSGSNPGSSGSGSSGGTITSQGGASSGGSTSYGVSINYDIDPPCHSDRDDFHKYPIRTSKGGGTKCTTCEKRERCHECCTCVWEYICVTYNIECSEISILNADLNLKAVQWNCENNNYDLSVTCDGYEIDLILKYIKGANGKCYAALYSDYFGLTAESPLKIEFSEKSNCRCPSWDFYLDGYNSIQIRPYQFVSVGNQRCIDRGPDDCTAGRCVPRNLCAKVYTVGDPTTPVTTSLTWYEDNYVEVEDCCCNATVFPETLIGRFVNFKDTCNCIAPTRIPSIYWPAKHAGNEITDAGSIIHFSHKVASYYDYYTNHYPNVPIGSNVWESETFFENVDGVTSVCPPFTINSCQNTGGQENPYFPVIGVRSILWCDINEKVWKCAVEIINIKESIENSNDDYIEKPYSPSNPYSSVYLQNVKILSCRPFHVKMENIYEPDNCATNNGDLGDGILDFHIQEFVGWIGTHPFDYTRKITMYSEVVKVSAPVQTLDYDCVPKMHIQKPGVHTLKDRNDSFDIDNLWPGSVFEKSSFDFCTDAHDQITKIEVFPEPCGGCEGIEPEDPYAVDVQTDCCQNRTPKKLYVTAIEDNDCSCAGTVSFELNWDTGEKAWLGSSSFCGRCTVHMKLYCGGTTTPLWQLEWGFDSTPSTYVWTPTVPLSDISFACNPFLWETRSVSNNTCCNSSMAASLFHWIITE